MPLLPPDPASPTQLLTHHVALCHCPPPSLPLQPDKAQLGSTLSPTNYPIPGAEPGRQSVYWYRDR